MICRRGDSGNQQSEIINYQSLTFISHPLWLHCGHHHSQECPGRYSCRVEAAGQTAQAFAQPGGRCVHRAGTRTQVPRSSNDAGRDSRPSFPCFSETGRFGLDRERQAAGPAMIVADTSLIASLLLSTPATSAATPPSPDTAQAARSAVLAGGAASSSSAASPQPAAAAAIQASAFIRRPPPCWAPTSWAPPSSRAPR